MISRARLRLLADYFAATRNEVAIDEMFLALSKKNPAAVGHFPRVPLWIGLATRRPYLTRAVSRIARVVWFAGGSALFFIREYLKFSGLHRSIGAFALPKSDGAILGLSTRVSDIVTPAQFPAFPGTWLTLPWVPLHGLPEGAKELPMLSILEKGDFLSALADALTVTQRIRRYRRLSSWGLQTYTAFRWFLVRRAIDRLSGELVTTEHFDRWAVLVDRAVRESRRAPCCRKRLIVVQHGAMGGLNKGAHIRKSSLNLPTRLRQVDELHAYNSNEAAAFRAEVFARGETSRALDIHFFKPAIELTGEATSDRPRLLFVGHPLCECFHIEVFRKLKAWKNFEVYYKPHPKAPMSASMAAVEWTIIKEANFFPRVDLLVSYPSTLVIEYEGVGVPASVHPLDVSIDDLPLFIEKTQEIIKIKCVKGAGSKESARPHSPNEEIRKNVMTQSHQICDHCIMDTSDPNIYFDAQGLCDYCNNFDRLIKPNWHTDSKGKHQLAQIADAIRQAGKGKDFDCIIGLSGGLDSSYVAYVAKEIMGLRPLLFHVDAGWNTDQAVGNIEKLVDGLGLDLYTDVVNWDAVKRMQVAFLRAGIPDQDLVQDAAFFAGLYNFARQYKIKHIITGSNFSTECCREPEEWGGYLGIDRTLFGDIWNRCGDGKANDEFPLVDILVYKLWYQKVLGMKVYHPLNLVPYFKRDAEDELERRFGWQRFQHKHHESRFTRFYEDYWLPRRFGYEKRRAHFSSLIMTGQMTRDEALVRISRPEMDQHFLKQEFEYVAHKLGLTVDELQQMFDMPKKTYRDYKNKRDLIGFGATVMRKVGLEKRYFR